MLMNDWQIALNEVIVRCEAAADHYREAAGMIQEAFLSALFRELSGQRREAAAALAEQVRERGELPRTVDGDRETVSLLVSRVKAAFSADQRETLLQERDQAEADLAACIAAALEEDLPETTRELLQRMFDDVASARQRLSSAKAAQ